MHPTQPEVTVTDDAKPGSDRDLPATPDHEVYLEISRQQDFLRRTLSSVPVSAPGKHQRSG